MRILKKILKIAGIVLIILLIGILIAAHVFLKPESDGQLLKRLDNPHSKAHIIHRVYQGFPYREIAMQQVIDTTLPTLVFVNGSPGSVLDFKRYFKDSLLNAKANILGYERIGYGPDNSGEAQGSIAFELGLLQNVTRGIPAKKIVLIGYSYGATIVMAAPAAYKHKISLAAAVDPKAEPMFPALKFYDWKLTRWLLPKKMQAAAKEKYSHLTDLPQYKDKWNLSPSPVLDIQGNKDWIVPYENSLYLKSKIDPGKFTLITIKGVGHELIWTDFKLIRNEILRTL